MRARHFLHLAAAICAASAPGVLPAQQPVRRVRAETLQRLRAALPSTGALTVSGRGGIDTVGARAPVVLRAGELLVAKESGVAQAAPRTDSTVTVATGDTV